MRTIALATLALVGCHSPTPSPQPPANTGGSPTAITSATDAIDRFLTTWDTDVEPHLSPDDWWGHQIDASIHEPEPRLRLHAELGACPDISRLSLDLVLYGSVELANHPRPRCWTLTYRCCKPGDPAGLDATALLDPDTGALLFAWRIPRPEADRGTVY